jgi:hypothetical protein
VIRKSTVQLAQLLDKGKNGASKDARHVLGTCFFLWLTTQTVVMRSWGWTLTLQLVRREVGNRCCCSSLLLMRVRAAGSYSTSQEVCPHISPLIVPWGIDEMVADVQRRNGSNHLRNTTTTPPPSLFTNRP